MAEDTPFLIFEVTPVVSTREVFLISSRSRSIGHSPLTLSQNLKHSLFLCRHFIKVKTDLITSYVLRCFVGHFALFHLAEKASSLGSKNEYLAGGMSMLQYF